MPESITVPKKETTPPTKKIEKPIHYDVDYDNPYAIASMAISEPKKETASSAQKTEEPAYYDVDYDNPYAIASMAITGSKQAAPSALPDNWEDEGGVVNADFLEAKPAPSALPDNWEDEGGVVNADFLEAKPAPSALPDNWEDEGGVVNADFLEAKPAPSALPDDWEDEGGVVNADFLEAKPAPAAEKPKYEEAEEVGKDTIGEEEEDDDDDDDDDDEFADIKLSDTEICEIATKISKAFEQLSEFDGFKKWDKGKIQERFEELSSLWDSDPSLWDEGDRKEIAQNLKESINPIRIIGNSVLRNEFSENLGKALAELCNTLTRFYNFITSNSDGERPSLQGGESRDDTPKFVSIDETGEQFEQLSDEDWQAIDAIFISSVSSANSSMEKTYKDINARIEKLKADDKTESESKEKSTALSFESTEANVDIINELVRHGLVSEGDWDYDPINIFSSNGLKGLQQTIATTKKFVSEASKDLLREQVGEAFNKKGLVTEEGKLEKNPLTIFKNARGIFGERKTNIKAMEEQKDWFRTLDSILKNANSELEKYKKDDSVINLQKIIDNSDEDFELDANEVAPFIGRMDGIITPILRYIIVACNQGGIDKLKNYKEFTTSNIDETESTEYNIGDLAQKFISYIHDPASAGIDDFEFEDKTKMSQTELYAYYKQREKHLAAQKTSKEQKRNELINLLMMTRSLTDTESLAIENELIKNKKTATGRFDSNNSTHDFFGSDGHSSHDINDSMPEEEKEGADLEKVNSDYRETLRLIGIIAQKYNLSKYRYASGTESHRSIQKLESGATNQRRPTIESIFRFMNNFVTTLEEKSLNGTPEKALAKALKDYAGNNGKNKPTDFDSAKEAYLAKLPQHGTEDLMTCPDKTFFTIVATLFKGQPSNEPQKTQAKTKPQK